MTIFCCCCCLLIKAKHQHGKNENKNTGLFINCMDFVVVRTNINKKKSSFFFLMLGPCQGKGQNNTLKKINKIVKKKLLKKIIDFC
jgi:hypothetical protein